MRLAAFSQRVYVGTAREVWRLEIVLGPDELANDLFDRLYVRRNAQVTGELDIHEIAVEPSGRIVFANTKYSCLAMLSATRSFKPLCVALRLIMRFYRILQFIALNCEIKARWRLRIAAIVRQSGGREFRPAFAKRSFRTAGDGQRLSPPTALRSQVGLGR